MRSRLAKNYIGQNKFSGMGTSGLGFSKSSSGASGQQGSMFLSTGV
ncbi:MAG: hypothetical protein NXI32_18150 [bacterium]|nr:hypothetical protein [bacterium]